MDSQKACHIREELDDMELARSPRSLLQKAVRSSERADVILGITEQAAEPSPEKVAESVTEAAEPSPEAAPAPMPEVSYNLSYNITASSPSPASLPTSEVTSTSLENPYRTQETTNISTPPSGDSSLPSTSPLPTSTVTSTTTSVPMNCTGVFAQGKCWYLSERGDSCAATCARNNRSFSFVVAGKDDPVMPYLLSRQLDGGKLQPWAALECYVESEDHWHPANEDAAKQYFGNVGAWTNAACRLACPCAEADTCKWKQPPACAPEFEWNGVWYTGCTSVDHDRPWCQHHHQHTEKDEPHPDDWSNCLYSCGPDTGNYAIEDGCEWTPASTCAPEFDYEGTHYVGCTAIDHHTPWCSNTDPYSGSWSHCTYGCKYKANDGLFNTTETADKLNEETAKDDMLCSWQPTPECSRAFSYKGVDYFGCTYEDHPTPWCSLDRVHRGFFSLCTRVCNTSASAVSIVATTTTTTTTPATTTEPSTTVVDVVTEAATTIAPSTEAPVANAARPSAQEKPCDRHPEAENDGIGQAATLDEAGYQLTAAADSPINMKRFICRVVDIIGCEVNDLSSLYGFVPHYSGTVSHQTYEHLEAELKIICHTGGKWIQPRPS